MTQGATELLPISSSGHLILVPWVADWHYLQTHEEFNKTFDVSLHLGTLISVVAYFWHDVVRYTAAFFRSVGARVDPQPRRADRVGDRARDDSGRGRRRRRRGLDRHPPRRPVADRGPARRFGILLWIADRTPQRAGISDTGLGRATAIGLSQILALMPGVSRSGITITAGRFSGLDRDAAARFSFLLLIPIVFGAVLFKGVKDVLLADLPSGSAGPFLVGTLASIAVGLVAIDVLLGYVRRRDYTPFVVYRLVLAALIVLVIATGWRDASF